MWSLDSPRRPEHAHSQSHHVSCCGSILRGRAQLELFAMWMDCGMWILSLADVLIETNPKVYTLPVYDILAYTELYSTSLCTCQIRYVECVFM